MFGSHLNPHTPSSYWNSWISSQENFYPSQSTGLCKLLNLMPLIKSKKYLVPISLTFGDFFFDDLISCSNWLTMLMVSFLPSPKSRSYGKKECPDIGRWMIDFTFSFLFKALKKKHVIMKFLFWPPHLSLHAMKGSKISSYFRTCSLRNLSKQLVISREPRDAVVSIHMYIEARLDFVLLVSKLKSQVCLW